MDANTLYMIGVGGCGLTCMNAMLWLGQWMSDRRWQFIGAGTLKWCLRRMWLNLGLAVVFAAAGVAGWWMRV